MKMRTALIIGVGLAVVAAAAVYLAMENWYWGYGYARPYGMMGYGYPYGYGTVSYPQLNSSNSYPYGYPYGMMGYPYMMGGGYGYVAYSFGEYSINESMQLAMAIPSYANVFRRNDTIRFNSNDVTLVVVAMMGNDAANMTGSLPPSYSKGDVFVIDGLINPTIIVPEGTVIRVLFINLDDDMYHNFVVTAAPPPYPYYAMPYVARGSGAGPGMMINMEWLPPADYGGGYAYSYAYTIALEQPGVYWYVCTYPGHAAEGMYGKIVVEPMGGR